MAGQDRSRARDPDVEGFVVRDGVRLSYEVFGDGQPTFLLLPTWSIVHSRVWKAQVPYLARHARVVTFDGRGNGRSDRPAGPAAYDERQFAADAVAVLDATGTGRAVVVGFSLGAQRGLLLAAEHPERVAAVVFIAPALPLNPLPAGRGPAAGFDAVLERYEGWDRYNRHAWLADYAGFVQFFFSRVFTEPHSTKQIEDAIGWAHQTTPETLVDTHLGPKLTTEETVALAAAVTCPVLVIHGSDDAVRSHATGVRLAELTGGQLVTIDGAGHAPPLRDPVLVNHLLRELVPSPVVRHRTRGPTRRRRALFVSSPIGLGHALRDVAIADELRKLHPDLEVDWLAQHPVTAVLAARGERIHPASAFLASESAHIESESAEHDLHCFGAWRRMDEILVANFMVFADVAEEGAYDLWIGDEAWEVDHFLHEHPELKTAAYAWLTDFVGWLPVEGADDRERFLTADHNAEMIEHISRFPRVRDRALFVGEPDDVVPDRFGPDLPAIRSWTEEHYEFPGYVTGFDPAAFADRAALRASLGYAPQEAVCLVTVGGSGVGEALLRRVVAAFEPARRRVPALRMVVVTGPRIDPRSLTAGGGRPPDGLEVRAFVPDLYRHLAACDVAVVQGGLTTAMELTANQRPFLSFPLRHHFEQQFHVRHRLHRYGAGRTMDYSRDGPEEIADAIATEIGRPVRYRPVDPGGAERAARAIADLL